MRVLVVNAGSSSLKLRLLDADDAVLGSTDLPAPGSRPDEVADALQALADPSTVDAVGHRVVHGGTRFTGPVRIDDAVEAELQALVDLAPLHQPRSLEGIAAISAVLPGVPAVACFDTAFHATIPATATTYAIPAEWRQRLGARRYGFHGLSHAYASRRAAELLQRDVASLRVVTCHLGAGVSLTAVHSGRSIDTTMGFTPLEGLVMATRSGNVDPGLVLWLQQHAGVTADELAEALTRRSGLLALAGTADMREVTARVAAGDEVATLALAIYSHRLRGGIAAMAAALSGVDAIAFTGGVGENEPLVRAEATAGLEFLGIAVNQGSNAAARGDADISTVGAGVATLVVAAREDLEIAHQVRRVLA